MTLIKFDKEDFPSLSLIEYSASLQAVGADQMYSPDEQKILVDFLGNLIPSFLGEEIDESQLLWIKASEGMLSEVYPPSIKALESGEIILQLGVNRFLIEIDKEKEKLICGELKGKIEFEEKEKEVVSKKADKVTEIKFRPGYVIFRPPSDLGSELEYKVKLALNLEIPQKISAMHQAIEAGDVAKFASFLNLAKKGGDFAETFKMQDLGLGEFEVVGIRSVEGNFNGAPKTSWVLELQDGREVWSRGNCDLMLKRGFQLPSDKPLTLCVTRVEEYKDSKGQSKYAVDCGFRLRAPYSLPSIPAPTPVKVRPILNPAHGIETMTAVLEPKTKDMVVARMIKFATEDDQKTELSASDFMESLKLTEPETDEIPF